MEVQVQQQEERHWKMMTNYVRNARAVGILWGFFVICYVIINVVVFIQPQWIGDITGGSTTGFFGLYSYCIFTESKFGCHGMYFFEYDAILSGEFKAATLLVGISILIIFLCILCFILFLLVPASVVYVVCGILLFISAALMFLGCIIYPAGWDHPEVRRICGNEGDFNLGDCEIRYAYILAILAIFVALVLAALAFILASRQVTKKTDDYRHNTIARSDLMYNVETESKPSIAIHPVLTAPSDHGADHYSEYTAASTRRSKHDFAL